MLCYFKNLCAYRLFTWYRSLVHPKILAWRSPPVKYCALNNITLQKVSISMHCNLRPLDVA